MNFFKNKNSVITYTVNKAINTNLYLSVQNGEVVINAPWYTTNDQIQKMLQEKREWILQKLQEYEQNCERKQQTVKLLGENYEVSVSYKAIKVPSLTIEDKKVKVTLPNQYKKIESTEIIEVLFQKMYELVAQREIENAMEKIRILTGIAPEDYEIKKMDKILAKCIDKKKIIFHTQIAKYKKETIEYIVLHEFCHLKYKNHTKSFYDMIETYLPNYEVYEKEISNLQY